MPLNKNAILRYQVLDKCFRNTGRNYTIEDLLEEINDKLLYDNPKSKGIKRRQLFLDIKFMESEAGWSIDLKRKKQGKKWFYRYRDSNFSINNSPLKEIELEQIKSTLSILSRIKGVSQFKWIEETIPKLEQNLGLKGNSEKIIDFESNQYLKGVKYLGVLFNAILYKKPLRISYQSFKSTKANDSVIHPYFLKQYNNRWYLFGQIARFDTLSNRALDRIISIEELDEDFIENTKYNMDDYFEDIIGVNRGKNMEPELIELHFLPSKAPYILTKPLHGSQKQKTFDETGLNITIEVILNYELKSTLLSFGNEVRVISPKSLDEELERMAYGKVYP